jgi:putative redox-active protein with C_GCAxxG_C_C motif
MSAVKNDTKKVFWKKGTCSQTFYYILNREFGHQNQVHETASDPLVGGILQLGHQCGLLMGSTLAVGKESFRRYEDLDKATSIAILASRKVRNAFEENAGSVNCREITNTDFSKKMQFAKFMVLKARSCMNLADKWTLDAIRSAKEGLEVDTEDLPKDPLSCASEVAKKMGATDEEIVTVAGFAGGLGLGGDACGALIAAIWLRSIKFTKENPGKPIHSNVYASNTLFTFDDATGSKFRCEDICHRRFENIEEHTDHIRNGGCAKLIEILANS